MLEAVQFFPGRVRCQACGESWRVPVQYPRERLALGWWRCPAGCNAAAGEALYSRRAAKSRAHGQSCRAARRAEGQGQAGGGL